MKPLSISTKITNRETESFKRYLNEVSEILPFETPEEEHECAVRAWNGDEKAKDELVIRNLRFVISCAKQYLINGVTLEDLVNEGNIGMTEAANRFDPTMGYKFISYAVWWIRKEITSFLTNNSRTIKLPSNKVDAVSKYKKNITILEQKLERPPNSYDMVEEYNEYTIDDVELLNELLNDDISSLNATIGDNDTQFSEILEDSSLGGADDLVVKEDMEFNINMIFSVLKEKEREVLLMLYGFNNGGLKRTLADVGEELGISREMVRQRREKAFDRIKDKLGRLNADIL